MYNDDLTPIAVVVALGILGATANAEPGAQETPRETYERLQAGLQGAEGAAKLDRLSQLAYLAHYGLKDYVAAERWYRDAIQASPEASSLRIDLAALYLRRLGDVAKATQELQGVLHAGRPPRAVQKAWSFLGDIHSEQDDYARALEAYGKAIAAGPSAIVDLQQPEDAKQQKVPGMLIWTAPSGGAHRYVIRHSRKAISTWDEFRRAQEYAHGKKPDTPGRRESLSIRGLPAGSYWFCVVAVDKDGRCSEVSNSVEITLLPERAESGSLEDDAEVDELEAESLRFDEPPDPALAAECLFRIAEIRESRLEDYSGATTAYKMFLGSRYLPALRPQVAFALRRHATGRIQWLEGELKRREDTHWDKKPEKTDVSLTLDQVYYFPEESCARVRVHWCSPHAIQELSARLFLERARSGERIGEIPVPAFTSRTIFRTVDIASLPVPDLPSRPFCFRAELLRGTEVIGQARSVSFGRMKRPPRELDPIRELGIDLYGNLLVNGQPFIPLGYSGGPFKFPAKVRDAGFNWAMQHEGPNFYTFKTTGGHLSVGEAGLMKFDGFTAASALLDVRATQSAGEGILSITTQDEPNGMIQGGVTSEHYFREYTKLTNLFVPNNLVEINLSDSARLSAFETFGRIGDIIFCEPWKGPGACANLTAITVAAARQSPRPVVPGMILMYPTWGGGFVALRSRYYCGLIQGARAFGNFSANSTFQHWDEYWKLFPETWPELFSLHRGVHEEIRLLTPVWAAPPIAQDLSVSESPPVGLQFVLRRSGGDYFLFAANPSWTKTSAQFQLRTGTPDKDAVVLFEDRTVPVRGGVLSDTFDTCDVHVYRF